MTPVVPWLRCSSLPAIRRCGYPDRAQRPGYPDFAFLIAIAFLTALWQQIREQFGIFFVAGSHALDHDHAGHRSAAPSFFQPVAQFHLGHNPVVFPVQEFFGGIFVRAGGDDDDAVFDYTVFVPPFDLHLGFKVPLKPVEIRRSRHSVRTWMFCRGVTSSVSCSR